jgi:hypothetical protein
LVCVLVDFVAFTFLPNGDVMGCCSLDLDLDRVVEQTRARSGSTPPAFKLSRMFSYVNVESLQEQNAKVQQTAERRVSGVEPTHRAGATDDDDD